MSGKNSTAITLPVHKVIHELPQVDCAVHLPFKISLCQKAGPDSCFETDCIIYSQDSTPSCQALSELGTLPLDAIVFASKLCRRCPTSSKQHMNMRNFNRNSSLRCVASLHMSNACITDIRPPCSSERLHERVTSSSRLSSPCSRPPQRMTCDM